jgi:uncharacterized protein (TIGR03083 family)
VKTSEIGDAVALERLALADLLESLTPEKLGQASLCAGWTIKHVAAHLTTLFSVTMPQMSIRIVRNRFNFAKAVNQLTNEMVARPIEEIVADLRKHASDTKHPPTLPFAPLTDVIIHGEDIRRPLGLTREVPFESVAAAMSFLTGGRAQGFAPNARVKGLRFQSTDGDGVWGSGQLIHGPALSLAMGIMGRRVALKELGGAVNVLESRLTAKVPRIQ